MSTLCPVCRTETSLQRDGTPYLVCPRCACWFQHPPPPKTYEADHELSESGESTGHMMSEHDRGVNRRLATALVRDTKLRPGARVLDVGSKYPFLSRCFAGLGMIAHGMEAIAAAERYGRELGVPMLLEDFEATPEARIKEAIGGPLALVTLVHVFEHLYDPIAALRKLRSLVDDDGHVFLRIPSHDVAGFERDLTPGHFAIHPFFHSLSSVLQALVEVRDLFAVASTYPLEGAGQRDVLLKPITRAPRIVAGMIAKNEERDLPRCLRSIADVVSSVVIVDTGSTDRTLEVARETLGSERVAARIYTGASEQDETGDWKLYDFSKARNVTVRAVDALDADLFLWMDADDELRTPDAIRRASYRLDRSVFEVPILSSRSERWYQHRMWRTRLGIHFRYPCHEYPTHGGYPCETLEDALVYHDAAPGSGESSNARNLRILTRAVENGDISTRTIFYLAQTHHHGGRHQEAARWYEKRIQLGVESWDEWIFAFLYKARCERAAGLSGDAEKTLLRGLAEAPGWAEFWMELAYIMSDHGKHQRAIGCALQAFGAPVPPTHLWRERNKYTDQPARLISWSYEHLGERERALEWARTARDQIDGPDESWDQRIARLSTSASAHTPLRSSRSIALVRPGAIGDVLMTLNLIPLLREANPGQRVVYYCHPSIGEGLQSVMRWAGVDEIRSSEESVVGHERVVNLIGYPLQEGYPEHPMRQHLLRYFAAEMGIKDEGELPALVLRRPTKPEGLPERYATLQVRTGWSAYKNWPFERWAEVVQACPNIRFVQIGAADEPRVEGADQSFMGTPIATAIALVANASLHVGLDSFANHLTHYRWRDREGLVHQTPGVILWGSTQPSASGYASNANVHLGLPCQPCFREDPKISRMPRGVCPNPGGQTYETPRHACMDGIVVRRVVDAVDQIWRGKRQLSLLEARAIS